jgi:hypothetical protein
MKNIQNEKVYIHNLLKSVSNNRYMNRCQTNDDCKQNYLYCDKSVDEDDNISKYGDCDIKKKINMIGDYCDKNENCISGLCKSNICRLNCVDTFVNNLSKYK